MKEVNTYRLGTRRNDGRGERTYINKKGMGVDWGGGGGGGDKWDGKGLKKQTKLLSLY